MINFIILFFVYKGDDMTNYNDYSKTYYPNDNIYKYNAEMKYVLNDEIDYIENVNIRSIVVVYDYDKNNMPMTFVSASLNKKLVDKMIQNQNQSYIILDIKRCIINSDMPELYSNYISSEFVYFISEDINKNDSIDYQDNNKDRDDVFRLISIGLIDLDHINKNKKTINGIISNSKLTSIVYYATSHLPILIEQFDNNDIFENLILPPMNSVSKTLQYLNSIKVFYKTRYRFFIDFDCAYLISSSGNFVKKKGEDIGTIMIEILNTYDQSSKLQGMSINEGQSLYKVTCDSVDCELSDDRFSEKSYSKISAVDSSGNRIDGSIEKLDSSIIKDKTKSIRVLNDNIGLMQNNISTINTSNVKILIQKIDVDSSLFTINKEYIIKADEVYGEGYNGKYLLISKRELYVRDDNNFTMNLMLLFEKICE